MVVLPLPAVMLMLLSVLLSAVVTERLPVRLVALMSPTRSVTT